MRKLRKFGERKLTIPNDFGDVGSTVSSPLRHESRFPVVLSVTIGILGSAMPGKDEQKPSVVFYRPLFGEKPTTGAFHRKVRFYLTLPIRQTLVVRTRRCRFPNGVLPFSSRQLDSFSVGEEPGRYYFTRRREGERWDRITHTCTHTRTHTLLCSCSRSIQRVSAPTAMLLVSFSDIPILDSWTDRNQKN